MMTDRHKVYMKVAKLIAYDGEGYIQSQLDLCVQACRYIILQEVDRLRAEVGMEPVNYKG